tara:strand:+ start:296 stop:1168 length:873 start_codon:yes stop_codon:yes gene_type:complete
MILGWFSTAHVATTGFFYIDKEFTSHIKIRSNRYITIPILSIIVCALLWGLLGKNNHGYLSVVFITWLLWHYQKQNVGLTSLVAQITKASGITQIERNVLMMVSIAGIIGALRFKSEYLGISYLTTETLFNIGLSLYILTIVIGIATATRRLQVDGIHNVHSGIFFLVSILFFAPTFLADSYFPAITSYAVAHGLQYWLMMTSIMYTSKSSNGLIRSLAGGIMVVIMIWGAIWLARKEELWGSWSNFLMGIQFGITVAHFIIDADAWRLREAYQRNYVFNRFGFLFNKRN